MKEVEIRFKKENQEGVIPPGTYLIDAARRFGIRFDEACDTAAGIHFCAVNVTTGSHLLSEETKAETEYFSSNPRGTNERLACQAKIDEPGEVVVMTKKKEKAAPPEAPETGADPNEAYRKEFAELPLEKKIANLVQLESIALGETVSFIINSPFKIGEKVLDVMAEFGFKKEERQKEAVRPEEHKTETNGKKGKSAKAEDTSGK
jgi:ferredoxin